MKRWQQQNEASMAATDGDGGSGSVVAGGQAARGSAAARQLLTDVIPREFSVADEHQTSIIRPRPGRERAKGRMLSSFSLALTQVDFYMPEDEPRISPAQIECHLQTDGEKLHSCLARSRRFGRIRRRCY